MAGNRTIAVAGGNSNTAATYDEAATVTAAEDIVARGTSDSGAWTINATLASRSGDLTNYPNASAITHAQGITWSIGTSSKPASNVALLLPAGTNYTPSNVGSSIIAFVSTQTGNLVTTNGVLMGRMTFTGSGGWVLQDAVTVKDVVNGGVFTVTGGNFNANGKTLTLSGFKSDSGTRTVTLDGSTVNLGSWGISVLLLATTGALTWSAVGTTFNVTDSSANSRTIAGAGQALGTVNYTAGGGTLIITGANSYTALTVTGCTGLTLPASVTQTAAALAIAGTPNKRLTLASSVSGTAATVSVASGTVRLNHLTIKDVTFTGGATFEAYDCQNVSGNTGITFKASKNGTLCGVGA